MIFLKISVHLVTGVAKESSMGILCYVPCQSKRWTLYLHVTNQQVNIKEAIDRNVQEHLSLMFRK